MDTANDQDFAIIKASGCVQVPWECHTALGRAVVHQLAVTADDLGECTHVHATAILMIEAYYAEPACYNLMPSRLPWGVSI